MRAELYVTGVEAASRVPGETACEAVPNISVRAVHGRVYAKEQPGAAREHVLSGAIGA
jgi:hypothetical protein